jgi:hypothetical protein
LWADSLDEILQIAFAKFHVNVIESGDTSMVQNRDKIDVVSFRGKSFNSPNFFQRIFNMPKNFSRKCLTFVSPCDCGLKPQIEVTSPFTVFRIYMVSKRQATSIYLVDSPK